MLEMKVHIVDLNTFIIFSLRCWHGVRVACTQNENSFQLNENAYACGNWLSIGHHPHARAILSLARVLNLNAVSMKELQKNKFISKNSVNMGFVSHADGAGAVGKSAHDALSNVAPRASLFNECFAFLVLGGDDPPDHPHFGRHADRREKK